MRPFTSLTNLLSLGLAYAFLLLVLLLGVDELMAFLLSLGATSSTLAIIIVAVFEVVLVAIVLGNVRAMWIDRQRRRAGAPFRFRLMIFLSVIAVASSLPQAILGVNVLRYHVDSFLETDMVESLDNAIATQLEALTQYETRIGRLSSAPQLMSYYDRFVEAPLDSWESYQVFEPSLVSVVLMSQGEALLSFGDPVDPRVLTPVQTPGDTRRFNRLGRNFAYTSISGTQGELFLLGQIPEYLLSNPLGLTRLRDNLRENTAFNPQIYTIQILLYGFVSLPLVLLAVMSSFRLSEDLIRPIGALESAIGRIGQGDYSFRLLARKDESIGNLVSSFNDMLQELEKSRSETQQAERISTWQDMAQQLAHEIKNPLTPIRMSAERLARRYQMVSAQEFEAILNQSTSVIIREVESISHLLGEFRSFASFPSPTKTLFDLPALITEICDSFEQMSHGTVKLRQGIAALEVRMDREQLRQVITNIVKNAVEAQTQVNGVGPVMVEVFPIQKLRENYVRIAVRDGGVGIEEDQRRRIFNPYFTTKRDGSGLGLAVVERIVHDHGGMVWFESQKGLGTTFFIDLPRGV